MGLEVGAAIGVLFFLANVVGSALFATGVAEGIFNNLGPRGQLVPGLLPAGYWYHLLYCGVTVAVNFVIWCSG
jgi:potassium/chloride transporter 9